MKKRILLLVLALAMLLSLAACGGKSETPAGETPAGEAPAAESGEAHTFYYATYADPILQWDPSGSVSNEVMVFNNVYETLLTYNPTTDEFGYKLATSYEKSDDGKTWTFHLREGVKFTDGSDFNADVVKYCFERTISLGLANAYLWDCLESVEVVDEYTAVFHLKYAAAADIICSGSYGSFIYSKEASESDPEYFNGGQMCGTGPYKLNSYQMGDYVVLDRNADYWGGWGDNQYDSVIFKLVSESSSRRQMIESGEVSAVNMLPAEDIAALSGSTSCRVVEAPTLKNMLVQLNTLSGACSDVRVRQALAYAVPYDSIVDVACGGHATVSKGYVPVGLWGHTDDVETNVYDLEKARALLADAGYADGLELVLTYASGDEMQRKAAELWQTELAKVGVTLSINAKTWDSQWDMARSTTLEDRQDILMEYWMIDIASPSGWMTMFQSEAEPSMNLCYLNDPAIDAAIAEANELGATDRDAAIEKYTAIQQTLAEYCPTISFVDTKDVWVFSNSVATQDLNSAYTMVVRVYDCTYAA